METKHKILIIDDSLLTVKILKNILKNDYIILTAFSGEDGLKIAESENPDLIILDVVMSVMDGYEVCQRLKDNNLLKDIPVIFITALGEMEDEKRGLEIGAIDYITKPFNEPIVKIRVKNHLELKRSRDILSELSSIDGLTGIFNKRYFEKEVNKEWEKAILNRTPLSLIILDIDNFKIYNDSYGHLEGDECLRIVSNCIKDCIKKEDGIVARFGGEEFVCLLPNTQLEEAVSKAISIFDNLKSLNIPFDYSHITKAVTLSAGLGTIYPSNKFILLNFIKSVDDLLYRAKNNGRNQIQYEIID